MKQVFVMLTSLLVSYGLFAQNLIVGNSEKEILKDAIKKYQECFEGISQPEPHMETYTLFNGKTVSAIAQSDFKRSVFTSTDEFIEDLKLWRDSPYFWQMKHFKKGKSIMDTQDLSNWEINSFSDITKSYFSEGSETFHISAHGCVDENNNVANKILIGGQYLDAEETADFIVQSMKGQFHHVINANEKPFTIVVHSCHSAEGENNFAQQLSKILAEKAIPNVYVVGAPDVLYCNMDGEGKYTEYVASKIDKAKGPQYHKNWIAYKKGESIGVEAKTYQEVIAKIQNK